MRKIPNWWGNAFKRAYEHNYENVEESRPEEAKNNIEIALINFHIEYVSLCSSFVSCTRYYRNFLIRRQNILYQFSIKKIVD